MNMNHWIVTRNGKIIEEVFYTKSCDADYVRTSLINHDGFPVDIKLHLIVR